METFSALLSICAGNSPVTGEFPTQRPVTWSFDVFFDLRLNKRLSKQSWGWWFETQSRSLWRHGKVPYDIVKSRRGEMRILLAVFGAVNELLTPLWWSTFSFFMFLKRQMVCTGKFGIVERNFYCLYLLLPVLLLLFVFCTLPKICLLISSQMCLLRKNSFILSTLYCDIP